MEFVKLFLNYAVDVNAVNSLGRTALHYAATRGSSEIMQMLLNRGTDIRKLDSKNKSVLHHAMFANDDDTQTILLIIKHFGASINLKDVHGTTALLIAIKVRKLKFVEYLLKQEAKVNCHLWYDDSLYDSCPRKFRANC